MRSCKLCRICGGDHDQHPGIITGNFWPIKLTAIVHLEQFSMHCAISVRQFCFDWTPFTAFSHVLTCNWRDDRWFRAKQRGI